MKRKKRFKVHHFIIVGFLLIFCFIILYPVLWSIMTSFKSHADIMTNKTSFFPKRFTVEGYIKAYQKAPVGKWFLNSVLTTTITTIATIFTGTLIGYVFAKFEFKFKNQIFMLLIITTMVPAIVTIIPRYLIIQKIGLFNTLGAIIIPRIVTPFSIFLSRQFISDIPDSFCEAAMIEGAGPFRIYYDIILPNLKPLIGSIAIFTAMSVWNDYLNPLIMLNDIDKMTLPLGLIIFDGQRNADMSATMAMANIVMIPMILLFVFLQKSFIKGITSSGIR
ncbi:MAG: carbohydrate ABC transporter permease [Finegoldia sp.]|nr:carbohydrate ABC transporter permease [Finegoldia sp.]